MSSKHSDNKASAENSRCGFTTILGLPNAGKSTLLNTLTGQKVSIVSPKAQTTRTLVSGIIIHENAQIIFQDTPGIFGGKNAFEKKMVQASWGALSGCDLIIHLIDVSIKNPVQRNEIIFEQIKKIRADLNPDHSKADGSMSPISDNDIKAIIVLNKIDKIAKEKTLPLMQEIFQQCSYDAAFMISALKDNGIKELLKYMAKAMPLGAWHYNEEEVSDMPMRLFAAEITREKIFHYLHQELPYSIHVETQTWEDFDNGDIKIGQIIYVEKASQKSIVLGKAGQKIKKIGQLAREELQDMLERKVHLNLFVKVKENWKDLEEFQSF